MLPHAHYNRMRQSLNDLPNMSTKEAASYLGVSSRFLEKLRVIGGERDQIAFGSVAGSYTAKPILIGFSRKDATAPRAILVFAIVIPAAFQQPSISWTAQMSAETLARALGGRKVGTNWMAKCPVHYDRTPSLSISEGGGGKVLVRCQAGCSQEDVIEALKSPGLWNDPAPTRYTCFYLEPLRGMQGLLPKEITHSEFGISLCPRLAGGGGWKATWMLGKQPKRSAPQNSEAAFCRRISDFAPHSGKKPVPFLPYLTLPGRSLGSKSAAIASRRGCSRSPTCHAFRSQLLTVVRIDHIAHLGLSSADIFPRIKLSKPKKNDVFRMTKRNNTQLVSPAVAHSAHPRSVTKNRVR